MVAFVYIMAVVIALQRLSELWLATVNRRWLVQQGAQEFGAGHYPLFFILHGGWLAGWCSEAILQGADLSLLWPLWIAVWAGAQGLRYWCIFSLGRHWNTRILVIPGKELVCRGPYRYCRHPNYLAVTSETLAVPLIFGAWYTAAVFTVLNSLLLLMIRIPQEEKVLCELAKKSGKY
jgi:methyltransferase